MSSEGASREPAQEPENEEKGSFEINSATISQASECLRKIQEKIQNPAAKFPGEELVQTLDTQENFVWKCVGSIFVIPDLLTAQKLQKILLTFCDKSKWNKFVNSSQSGPLCFCHHLSARSDLFSASPSSTVFVESVVIQRLGKSAPAAFVSSPHLSKGNIMAPVWFLRGTERKQHAFSVIPFTSWYSSPHTILWINEDSADDPVMNHVYPYKHFKENRKKIDAKLCADDGFFSFIRSPSSRKVLVSEPQGLRRLKLDSAGDISRMLQSFNGTLLAQTTAGGSASLLKNVKLGYDAFQNWLFLQIGNGLVLPQEQILAYLADPPLVWLEIARDEPMLGSSSVVEVFGDVDEIGNRPKQSLAAFFPRNFHRPPTIWFNRDSLNVDSVSEEEMPLSVFGSMSSMSYEKKKLETNSVPSVVVTEVSEKSQTQKQTSEEKPGNVEKSEPKRDSLLGATEIEF